MKNKKIILRMITTIILLLLTVQSHSFYLSEAVLLFYLIVCSFINNQSSENNDFHISWLAILTTLSLFSEEPFLKVGAIALAPLSLMYSCYKNKVSFYFTLFYSLSILLFVSSLYFLYLGDHNLAAITGMIGILIRQAQFPFHLWILQLKKSKINLYPSFFVLVLLQHGTLLFALTYEKELHIPLFEQFFTILTLISGSYLSVRAKMTKNLMERHLLLVLSQSTLVVAAFQFDNHLSMIGAFLFSLVILTAGSLFSFIGQSIYEQKSISHLGKYQSIYRTNKMTAYIYLFSGLSIVGLPFTLGYIAEDILFHGLIEIAPIFAVLYIVMTALNGFVIYETFCKLFLGHTTKKWLPLYFSKLNQIIVLFCTFVLIAGGFYIGPVTKKMESLFNNSSNQEITYHETE